MQLSFHNLILHNVVLICICVSFSLLWHCKKGQAVKSTSRIFDPENIVKQVKITAFHKSVFLLIVVVPCPFFSHIAFVTYFHPSRSHIITLLKLSACKAGDANLEMHPSKIYHGPIISLCFPFQAQNTSNLRSWVHDDYGHERPEKPTYFFCPDISLHSDLRKALK